MEPTVTAPRYREDLTQAKNAAFNYAHNVFTANSYLLNRAPEYVVFLCTVSDQTFEVSRPPLIKSLKINGMRLQDREQGYSVVTSFPQPMLHPRTSVDSDDLEFSPMDTRRFIMDIINPANLGIDQNQVIPAAGNFSIGQDLGARGVFYTLNYKMIENEKGQQVPAADPTQEEIKAAVKRMEKHYERILAEARTVEVSNPKGLQDMLTPEHHIAADYFGEEHGWHAKRSRPMDCPNCGERVKAGIAFHKTSEGDICVIDWARAIKSGARTRNQAGNAGIPGYEKYADKEPSEDKSAE